MAHKQHGLSRTLPKDFTFHAFDEPRTPTRPIKELEVPPPPHHSSCRLRRPRLNIFSNFEASTMPFCSPDVALPSIEFSQDPTAPSSNPLHHGETGLSSSDYLEVPPRQRCDPKTPEAQVRGDIVGESRSWREESLISALDPIPRPSSACSNISDSSVSSSGSFGSRPSFGGSCTSPESEIQDPFLSHSFPDQKQTFESPCKPTTAAGLPLQTPTGHRWTYEMDNHLWNTYQMYLQDPTITPFKTVPGSVPPLGVSYRVAREARRTWPRVKHNLARKHGQSVSRKSDLEAERELEVRSGSCTPTGVVNSKPLWPRSDASTRKRLKQLCRRRFSIAPHYQRLLQSRSPSPAPELFLRSSSNSMYGAGSSYNTPNHFTRDLGVSLVATSLPATIPEPVEQTNWFNNVAEQPLAVESPRQLMPQAQSNLMAEDPASIPRLGSPFMYHTWGPEVSRRRARPATPANIPETVHGTGSRLRSSIPAEMLTTTHKRRAINQLDDEVSPDRNAPPELMPEPPTDGKKNPNYRRVRLRNRGATTSGLSSRERLNQLFTPPSHFGSGESGSNVDAAPSSTSQNNPPPKDEVRRLGSPFSSDRCLGRPFQPRHAPSRSEPFILDRPSRNRALSLQGAQPLFQDEKDLAPHPALGGGLTTTTAGEHTLAPPLHIPDYRNPSV